MALEVRPVRPDEHLEAGRVTALAYQEFADSEAWDRYLDRLADVGGRAETGTVLVAVDEERILGTATVELERRIEDDEPPLPPDEAHIRMLGVDPQARGRGVGRALIEACLAYARDAGRTRLTLNTTQRMKAAQAMYESLGFERLPDRTFPDGFVLLSYERAIPPA